MHKVSLKFDQQFWRYAPDKFSVQIFQKAITPLKFIQPVQDYDMHN